MKTRYFSTFWACLGIPGHAHPKYDNQFAALMERYLLAKIENDSLLKVLSCRFNNTWNMFILIILGKIQSFAFIAQFVPKLQCPVSAKKEHKCLLMFVNKRINIWNILKMTKTINMKFGKRFSLVEGTLSEIFKLIPFLVTQKL